MVVCMPFKVSHEPMPVTANHDSEVRLVEINAICVIDQASAFYACVKG